MENKMTEIFLDTQRMLWENEELRCRTWSAVMNTRVFPEMFETTRVMGTRLTRNPSAGSLPYLRPGVWLQQD